MAVDDGFDDECNEHKRKAAIFCHSCQQLLCTRCITRPSAEFGTSHTDHTLLEIGEAYDILQETLLKSTSHFADLLEQLKEKGKEKLKRLQKFKLDLLRRDTQSSRAVKSVVDVISRRQKRYIRQHQLHMTPAIKHGEKIFSDLEFDIVSGKGLVDSSEALLALPRNRCEKFVAGAVSVMREMQKITTKAAASTPSEPILASSPSIRYNVQQAKRGLRHMFQEATAGPAEPKLIRTWCVISSITASLVWKYRPADSVLHFHIFLFNSNDLGSFDDLDGFYKQATGQKLDGIHYESGDICGAEKKVEHRLCSADVTEHACPDTTGLKTGLGNVACCQHHKLRSFTSRRAQYTLRSLLPDTTYLCVIQACNSHGASTPHKVTFRTSHTGGKILTGKERANYFEGYLCSKLSDADSREARIIAACQPKTEVVDELDDVTLMQRVTNFFVFGNG